MEPGHNDSSSNSSSDDDGNSIEDDDFNIFFSVPNSHNFDDLIDDWDFISVSNTKIELIDVSGGNGGTDYLTFENYNMPFCPRNRALWGSGFFYLKNKPWGWNWELIAVLAL